jgi:hypothetical protein
VHRLISIFGVKRMQTSLVDLSMLPSVSASTSPLISALPLPFVTMPGPAILAKTPASQILVKVPASLTVGERNLVGLLNGELSFSGDSVNYFDDDGMPEYRSPTPIEAEVCVKRLFEEVLPLFSLAPTLTSQAFAEILPDDAGRFADALLHQRFATYDTFPVVYQGEWILFASGKSACEAWGMSTLLMMRQWEVVEAGAV